MIYSPKQALQALSKFQRLDVGDLIITGTPIGTALSAPPKIVEKLIFLLSPTVRWKLFFSVQSRNPRYLRPGDVVELEVATDDGKIDLGSQSTTVLDR